MDAIELLLPDGKPSGVFACGRCLSVDKYRPHAEQCCLCPRCGKPRGREDRHLGYPTERHAGGVMHKSCADETYREMESAREAKAEKVDSWDGWIYTGGHGGNNGYFESVEEYMEFCENEGVRPEFAWTADPEPFPGLHLEEILERLEEEMNWEDAADSLDGTKELGEAIKAFNETNKNVGSWMQNDKRMVRLDWAAWDAAESVK